MAIERIGEREIEIQARMEVQKQVVQDIANQFEAVFMQSMLKSNCIEQHFTDETNDTTVDSLAYTMDRPLLAPADLKVRSNHVERAIDLDVNLVDKSPNVEQVNQTIDDFVKSIWPYARQASNLLGLDPKILMAQAALETGWGQLIAKDANGSSSNNVFNIKAQSPEQSVEIKTTEYISNAPVSMIASFKKYPSVAHSFDDYVSLMQGARYKTALANTDDPARYIDALQRAGYATDPEYAHKILLIYHGDGLQQALERNGCA